MSSRVLSLFDFVQVVGIETLVNFIESFNWQLEQGTEGSMGSTLLGLSNLSDLDILVACFNFRKSIVTLSKSYCCSLNPFDQ